MTLAPELADMRAGRAAGGAAARAARRHPDRRRAPCRACSPSTTWRRAAAAETRRARRALAAPLQFDDPINIQFTSGTTGSPKGATLTHHNMLNNGFFIGEAMRLTEQDRLCIPVPLYHCFGMVLGDLACVTHGAAMVYPGRGLRPAGRAGDGGRRSAAPACTACPPCSSPRWSTRASPSSTSRACAPASWPARPARSR